jgi:ATP-binding cassette subfamily B multidrug efflux pump
MAQELHEDTVERRSADARTLRLLFGFLSGAYARVAWGIALALLSVVLAMLSAWQLGALVGLVLDAKAAGTLQSSAAALTGRVFVIVSAEALSLLLSYYGRRLLSQGALHAIYALRAKLFEHLQNLPLSYFDRTPQGRSLTRLTNDVEALEDFFSGTFARILSCLLMAAAALAAMLLTSPWLGLLVVVLVLPSVLLTYATRSTSRVLNRDLARANSANNARLSEFVQALPLIRGLALEAWSQRKVEDQLRVYAAANFQLLRVFAWLRPLVGSLSTAPLVVFVLVGARAVLQGSLSVGSFVSFVRYFERFGRPVLELSFELHVLQQALASAERLTSFLNEQTEQAQLGAATGQRSALELHGEVECRNLSMRYAGSELVLRDISFKVEAGSMLGLTGATGSGKSSTVSLLSRLYPFEQGQLLLDGVDISEYELGSLRRAIGYVTQEVMILRASVRENLCLDRIVSDEKLHTICAQTGFADVLRRAQLTLDSPILEYGANLSVGERQLLSFTRTLLLDPKVLVLDEATANVDQHYERQLQSAMEQLMQGRTCIIIAHRLETLRRCQQILVFNQGQIVERGDHQSLLQLGGYYARLWQPGGGGV